MALCWHPLQRNSKQVSLLDQMICVKLGWSGVGGQISDSAGGSSPPFHPHHSITSSPPAPTTHLRQLLTYS
eukprot:scaffold18902_cov70-Skeletonema_marinoi.AAC.3